jgi:E3 ubiquitin-protein ligase UBR1
MACFDFEFHKNHEIHFHISQNTGGCCDCGDQQAWKNDIGCKIHPKDMQVDNEPEMQIIPFPQVYLPLTNPRTL